VRLTFEKALLLLLSTTRMSSWFASGLKEFRSSLFMFNSSGGGVLEEGGLDCRLRSEALLPRFASNRKAPAVTRNAPTVPKDHVRKLLMPNLQALFR
jgi:hypothetical protein